MYHKTIEMQNIKNIVIVIFYLVLNEFKNIGIRKNKIYQKIRNWIGKEKYEKCFLNFLKSYSKTLGYSIISGQTYRKYSKTAEIKLKKLTVGISFQSSKNPKLLQIIRLDILVKQMTQNLNADVYYVLDKLNYLKINKIYNKKN